MYGELYYWRSMFIISHIVLFNASTFLSFSLRWSSNVMTALNAITTTVQWCNLSTNIMNYCANLPAIKGWILDKSSRAPIKILLLATNPLTVAAIAWPSGVDFATSAIWETTEPTVPSWGEAIPLPTVRMPSSVYREERTEEKRGRRGRKDTPRLPAVFWTLSESLCRSCSVYEAFSISSWMRVSNGDSGPLASSAFTLRLLPAARLDIWLTTEG